MYLVPVPAHVGAFNRRILVSIGVRPPVPDEGLLHIVDIRPRGKQTGLLDELVATGAPFFCHQGIRKPIAWRHPPSGTEIPGHPGGYDPPIRDGVPYKADGSPAFICAGWLLRRAKETQRQGENAA